MVAGSFDSIKLARLLPLELLPILRLVHATSESEPEASRPLATVTVTPTECNSDSNCSADGLGCYWRWVSAHGLPLPPLICKNIGKHPVISEFQAKFRASQPNICMYSVCADPIWRTPPRGTRPGPLERPSCSSLRSPMHRDDLRTTISKRGSTYGGGSNVPICLLCQCITQCVGATGQPSRRRWASPHPSGRRW
jgi:hypothetical protein